MEIVSSNRDIEVGKEAARALSQFATKYVPADFFKQEYLRAPNYVLKYYLLKGLRKTDPDAAERVMLDIFNNRNGSSNSREMAFRRLVEWNSFGENKVPFLADTALNDPSDFIRMEAAYLLLRDPECWSTPVLPDVLALQIKGIFGSRSSFILGAQGLDKDCKVVIDAIKLCAENGVDPKVLTTRLISMYRRLEELQRDTSPGSLHPGVYEQKKCEVIRAMASMEEGMVMAIPFLKSRIVVAGIEEKVEIMGVLAKRGDNESLRDLALLSFIHNNRQATKMLTEVIYSKIF